MPYVRDNYCKRAQYIREVYFKVKEDDIPDTRIVRSVFPRYNIWISYRQWMNIKNMRINRQPQPVSQMAMFG